MSTKRILSGAGHRLRLNPGLVLSLSLILSLVSTQLYASGDSKRSENVQEIQELPLDELRTFGEVFERIKRAYVHDIDDKELLNNAIRGMISGLDPHSAYLTPQDFDELQESTQGEFGGLGLEVGSENGFIKVVTPIDDTPAAKAGIRPHDLIVKINDTPVKNLPLNKSIELMRGKPGTEIRLTIMRDGLDVPFEVTLERALIRVTSVKHRMLDQGYGYIRITQFQVHTGEEVVKALNKMHQSSENKLKGVVLDLRNNPGGVLQAAAEVVDAFITEGRIVYTKGRLDDTELSFDATPNNPASGVPLVVLINEGSASASEIVAGALQDHRRSVIMGTQSFGKGSVQTILPLGSDHGLKLTTALYYTPSGRSIQAQGITPDIEVKPARLTPITAQLQIKEADLEGHLESGQQGAQGVSTEASKSALAETDYQLFQALSLLKGMYILNGTP